MYHNNPPIIYKTYKFYLLLYSYTQIFPKKDRFALGQKCENLTLDLLESLFVANSKKDDEKLPYLYDIDIRLKILQTFIRIINDARAVEAKDYLIMSSALEELGRMLGGWIKSLKPKNENPAV
ncbi:MAG: diversity-generating retroelement protein Avd [Parcubacteria group bacterium]|jgi:hypothetical protein